MSRSTTTTFWNSDIMTKDNPGYMKLMGYDELMKQIKDLNQLKPLTVQASWGEEGSGVKTFKNPMQYFSITNDGWDDLFFEINGLQFLVKSGEVFESRFEPFEKIIIETLSQYRAYVKG